MEKQYGRNVLVSGMQKRGRAAAGVVLRHRRSAAARCLRCRRGAEGPAGRDCLLCGLTHTLLARLAAASQPPASARRLAPTGGYRP